MTKTAVIENEKMMRPRAKGRVFGVIIVEMTTNYTTILGKSGLILEITS